MMLILDSQSGRADGGCCRRAFGVKADIVTIAKGCIRPAADAGRASRVMTGRGPRKYVRGIRQLCRRARDDCAPQERHEESEVVGTICGAPAWAAGQ